jgi:transcriptional regulator with XRE-family HTH domain
MARNTLGKFILDELKKRDMSMRQFAAVVGVSDATISRLVSLADPPEPTLDFLAKISRVTGVDVCTLVAMVLPDSQVTPILDPEARLLVDRIRKLPPDAQQLIEILIIQTVFKNAQDTT